MEEEQCTKETKAQRQCGLYLARSTIPNAGLGVFTGIAHEFGETVAPPEIAHNIITETLSSTTNGYWGDSLGHEYTWNPHVAGGQFEGKDVQVLIPGLGMAANSFTVQVNARSIMGPIDSAGVNAPKDEGNGDYIKSPGSGAFSSYHGFIYTAELPMDAGSEIFVDYGDAYFRNRPWIYGDVPLAPEFHKADEMLEAFWSSLPHGSLGEWQSTWDVIREQFVADERVRNALPVSVEDIAHVVEVGTSNHFLGGENPRSLEWLEENGMCMDHIVEGNSDIPHAGRGAFAKRSFVAGEKIHPMPLMQIPRHGLELYKDWSYDNVAGHQLLLNYCFGHKDSSMLLFPYSSSSSFINHGGKEANAKLVWTDGSDPFNWHDESALKLSVEELLEHRKTSLLMLLVATKDIEIGDEVTIDYGTEWEQAWLDHVKNSWTLETSVKSASEYNESEEMINTVFEESYPSTVGTACHFWLDPDWFEEYRLLFPIDDPNKVPINLDSALHMDYSDEDLEKLKSKLGKIEEYAFPWQSSHRYLSGDHLQACTVISRHSTRAPEGSLNYDTYTVRIYLPDSIKHNHGPQSQTELYVKNVPRRAITFVDRAGTSDLHQPKAFRHEIGFPDADDIWPNAWKDM